MSKYPLIKRLGVVSPSLALILKQRGFNEECTHYYLTSQDGTIGSGIPGRSGNPSDFLRNWNAYPTRASAPVYHQVVNWLMETHNIFVYVIPDPPVAFEYRAEILGIPQSLFVGTAKTYNEAWEKGIEQGLKLINYELL